MKTLRLLAVPFFITLFLVFTSATDGGRETEKLHDAANVLKEFDKMKESIPHDLISEYQGIVIIPNMINAGLGIGGKRGKGVAIVKLDDGSWSDPVFVTLTGGSIGPQIGVQAVDLVMVFRHKGALTRVKNGDVTIGGDISAAAGPVGRTTSANTDYEFKAEVYSYSRSRGLFAGISLNGTSLSIDKAANRSYYGDDMTAHDIFNDSKSTTKAVTNLKNTLAELAANKENQ
ncbi:MAG: lipid-binding SYLF domain-containing protein [Bacteroidetes bacterium]|nr:lipid-binding SYLF domain-containing protein [Bacteroidota bacterium]